MTANLPEIRINAIHSGKARAAIWTLHAANGQRLATSRHYKTTTGAIRGARRAVRLFGNVRLIDQWNRPIEEI